MKYLVLAREDLTIKWKDKYQGIRKLHMCVNSFLKMSFTNTNMWESRERFRFTQRKGRLLTIRVPHKSYDLKFNKRWNKCMVLSLRHYSKFVRDR